MKNGFKFSINWNQPKVETLNAVFRTVKILNQINLEKYIVLIIKLSTNFKHFPPDQMSELNQLFMPLHHTKHHRWNNKP